MSSASANAPSSDELKLVSRSVSDNVRRTELSVPDMHCGACMTRIEKALIKIDGVEDVRVNLTNKSVAICWSVFINPCLFVEQLILLGFHPVLPAVQVQRKDAQFSAYLRALAVSGFATGNIMLLSVSVWAGADNSTRLLFHWLSALIAIPAVVYAGRFFFRSAWYALRSGKSNMDVPISVGISLACIMSLYDTVMKADQVYFEAAIMLVFFLLIGRTVDHLMRQRAASAVDGLQSLEPLSAQRCLPDGSCKRVKTSALVAGDRIIVSPGERIPADGTVVSGISEINTELVDGESLPRTVLANQPVLSGSFNLSAPLEIKVTAVAAKSFLASMQQLVRNGETRKGAYRRLADRASQWYTPVVHSAALLAFFLWYVMSGDMHRSITVAISVLIITCPCALALAVPMVQALAAQRLFSSGIVMKNGAALEKMNKIDTVVFDKTGTLTDGFPAVSGRSNFNDRSLQVAQALAAHSEHPFANAIIRIPTDCREMSAMDTDLHFEDIEDIKNIKEVPGFGIEAKSGSSIFRLGKRSWATNLACIGSQHEDSRSESVLTNNGLIIASFEFEQHLRTDAALAIERLTKQVDRLIIVSGDSTRPVQATASRLSIDTVFSHCLPADKQTNILNRVEQGHGVLMVGDGLNDAGAMAAATVSMAPAKAASVSRTVADFVFLRPSLVAVPVVLSVARQAHTLIQQNFAIAILYNLIALPVAFAGLVTPLIAAIAMSTSSVLVVANAMRIAPSTSKSGGGLEVKKAPEAIGVVA